LLGNDTPTIAAAIRQFDDRVCDPVHAGHGVGSAIRSWNSATIALMTLLIIPKGVRNVTRNPHLPRPSNRNRAAHRTIADYGARFICL
jgi:hypothetical protein